MLTGCAAERVTVKSELIDFGGVRASVRDFPRETICEAEQRFLLDELSSMNGLLLNFISRAPVGLEADWSASNEALMEEANERLPPLLARHEHSLNSIKGCPWRAGGAWPGIIERGEALIARTRDRLAAAPEELRAVRARRTLQLWRAERRTRQEAARRACTPRGNSSIYFAWTDESTTTWLFCDGAQVTRAGDERPEVELAPVELRRGARRPKEAAYLGAVERYPAQAVAAPPGEAGAPTVEAAIDPW